MENKQRSDTEDVSSANAVLLGALAPGVNGPTWNTLKFAFLMLGLCLAAMLGLAFSSSDIGLILHVTLLFLITGTLFILLTSGYACELAWKRCELGCPVGIWKCILYLCLAILAGILNMCETGVAPMLQGFLAETGLVSVEHQMQEMGLAPKDSAAINKKSS